VNQLPDTALLVGCGSIGRRHARALAKSCDSLAIVESKAASRDEASAEHPTARVVERLEELDAAAFPWDRTVAVIATWGPSHAEYFHALADRGVRHILCEKPMASSAADAAAMVERAERDGIALGVHHYMRYVGLVPALRRLAEEHGLGEPVSVVVEGGAACLLTNGLHWVDFATELFGEAPNGVVSTACGEGINPRSPDLMIYGGTAVWSFGDRREAVITFSNRSSIALGARVYFRDAVADIDGDFGVRLARRDPAAVERFPAVTRTGPAAELLFEGVPPDVLHYLDGMQAAVEDVRRGGSLRCDGRMGATAVAACIGALMSSAQGTRVALPLDVTGGWIDRQWPIS
jgi:predicted dehydrogenase